ncbi:hypothetical protein N9B13_01485, partial [Akkermansiaceae bacterium]|nr:hypothetical protein [Akkermansiaceae bacterium]
MNDAQEPELPAHESPEVEIPSPKKKAVKKAAKKAVKKTAKKAAKKTTRKKVAKRAAKKTSLKTPTDEVVVEEADVEEVTSPVAPSPVAPAKAVLVLETETITPLIEPGPSSSEEPADKAETETGEVER